MGNIILFELNGKMAFKKGDDGFGYTFNKNEKSRRKAYKDACSSHNTKRT